MPCHSINGMNGRIDLRQKTSQPQPHPLSSKHAALIRALENAIAKATAEHFPSRTTGIHPVNDDAAIVMVLAANKYSPQNFWNGRWQSTYTIDPTTFAAKGVIKVDVHYYEDGNVRMISSKQVEFAADNAEAIAREISKAENRYQEELNRGFVALAEGSFKVSRGSILGFVRWSILQLKRKSLTRARTGSASPAACDETKGRMGKDWWLQARPGRGWWKAKVTRTIAPGR